MQYDVHLTGITDGKARTLRAIRAAIMRLGGQGSLSDASEVLADYHAGSPAYLGTGDDEQAKAAVLLLREFGCDGTVDAEATEDDMTDVVITDPNFVPSGNTPSYTAAQVTMVLLHALEGEPSNALRIARAFGRLTDDDLWDEVADCLLEAFPAKPRPAGN